MRISDWSSDVCSSDLLRIYAASDHAVGTKQANDKTCLLIVGVDEYNNIWLLDCFWKRTKTDEVVDAMIHMMRKWRPMFWWAEGGHIRSEEHTSELQSLMRISYAVFCLKKKKSKYTTQRSRR